MACFLSGFYYCLLAQVLLDTLSFIQRYFVVYLWILLQIGFQAELLSVSGTYFFSSFYFDGPKNRARRHNVLFQRFTQSFSLCLRILIHLATPIRKVWGIAENMIMLKAILVVSSVSL